MQQLAPNGPSVLGGPGQDLEDRSRGRAPRVARSRDRRQLRRRSGRSRDFGLLERRSLSTRKADEFPCVAHPGHVRASREPSTTSAVLFIEQLEARFAERLRRRGQESDRQRRRDLPPRHAVREPDRRERQHADRGVQRLERHHRNPALLRRRVPLDRNGATWTNIHPFCFGHDNYGSPSLVYDVRDSKWVATFVASGCGAGGIASWSSTDNGLTWGTSCAHSGSSDDRPSMAVDRNSSSPFYGRIYMTWNDFAVGGGALRSTYSTTPASPGARRRLSSEASDATSRCRRVRQRRENLRRCDGRGRRRPERPTAKLRLQVDRRGRHLGLVHHGRDVPRTGQAACNNGYFAGMYTTPVAGYWRHNGWGDIGVV